MANSIIHNISDDIAINIGDPISESYPETLVINYTSNNSQTTYSTVGGSYWQSFTAPRSGYITQFDALRSNTSPPGAKGSVVGTIKIYEGEGTGGTLLGNGYYSSSAASGWIPMLITEPIFLEGDKQYTAWTNQTGGVGLFYFRYQNPGTYPGGKLSFGIGRDLTFRLWMQSAELS